MSCGVGCRCGSDPPLLWPAATASVQPPNLGTSIFCGYGSKKKEREKKKKKRVSWKNKTKKDGDSGNLAGPPLGALFPEQPLKAVGKGFLEQSVLQLAAPTA